MLQKYEDADRVFREGEPILGRGWKEVEAFDDLEDVDEYESDEEEMYVVMDLGNGIDNKSLLAENSYQLIGLDTPLPFLKLGNHVYQGEPVKMIGDEIIFGRIRNEEDPQKSERPPWHTTSLRLRFRPIILRDKDQASAETHGREDSPSITSAQTTRPGVKSSFNNSGPSHQAPPTLPSQVEVSGKPFYQRAPAVLGAGGTRISPLPPLSERSVTPSVGPRSSVSPTKAGLEELEAVWRQSNTPTSVNQDLPRETSAPPPGSHISDVASLYTRLNDTSLSPEKEAGPSRNRSRASSAAQGSLSFGISKKTRESILKANLLPKVDGKLLLAKISDLSAFDVDQYPKEARFVLSKEVEEFLKPRTTEKHAIEVQKRGYTTMELRHVLAGKPMKGVGSRPGAQKTKIHGIDVPSGDLGVDEEDGHLGQGGQGPSTVLPFVVETRIADEKKGKGRGKERSQGGAKSTSAPGESMAVDDLEKGIDNGAIGFEEEDDPLVTIDDIDMTF